MFACSTHHVDDEDVPDSSNDDNDAEHDGDHVLGDDLDVLLLVLRHRDVGSCVS